MSDYTDLKRHPLSAESERRICKFPECGRPHSDHGYCHGHSHQLRTKGVLVPLRARRPNGSDPIIRFVSVPCKVSGVVGDCHEWVGAKDKNGYGQTNINRKNVYTHRYVYERANGPIPDGLEVDHVCRNKSCCNLLHLRLVTRAENVLENSDGLAAVNRRKTHCVHGHKFDEANTKIREYAPGKPRRDCRKCIKSRIRKGVS